MNQRLLSLETRSHASSSNHSSDSSRSSASAAARARAKVEAAKARLMFAEKEHKMKMEKYQLEASIEKLAIEKEIAIAKAKVSVFEEAAMTVGQHQVGEYCLMSDSFDPVQRTRQFVEEQAKELPRFQEQEMQSHTVQPAYVYDSQPKTERPVPLAPHTDLRMTSHGAPTKRESLNPFHPPKRNEHRTYSVSMYPGQDMAQNHLLPSDMDPTPPRPQYTHGHAYNQPEEHQQQPLPYINNNPPHTFPPDVTPRSHCYEPQPNNAPYDTHMTDFVRFLARRELVTTGLIQFNDKPESYRAWRRSFLNTTRGLDLSYSEEIDLLVKWLGKESAEHAKRIRSVYLSHPEEGLRMIWNRLDECYGSIEAFEKALFEKLDRFPKINHKEYSKLRDLSDLLMELEAAKMDGGLPGLSYLDTARGVNPIVHKLPYGLQEKWLFYGSNYKLQHQVAYPPFSVFVTFISQQAQIRNDPSFALTGHTEPHKAEKPPWKSTKQREVSVHKTEVFAGTSTDQDNEVKDAERPHKTCPLHKKPHSLQRCRGFRLKPIEERKMFLKETGLCFKCCVSTSHAAKVCPSTVKCTECGSERHPTALHPGPAPWISKPSPSSEHGGESESASVGEVTNQCTQVCGGDLKDRSCSKILLAKVYPGGCRGKAKKVYVILDEQSNRSLARSDLFDAFDIVTPTTSYSLRTCSGVTQIAGRIADGFYIESMNGQVVRLLPKLLECNNIPDNRGEIPTPNVAQLHPHLHQIAQDIPEFEPNVPIMLLLGRDIISLHKVRKYINGPFSAPYAQKLDLGWVIVGNVCLGSTDKTTRVNTLFTSAIEQGRPTMFKPCSSALSVRESYTIGHHILGSGKVAPSISENTHLGRAVFQVTNKDNKLAPSIDDLNFMAIMKQCVKKNDSNSWVAPLPFRSPRPRLPDNKPQALNRFFALKRSLEKKPEMSKHFFAFMEKIFENGHAEVAPPLKENEEKWYLPIFGVYHPKKPGNIRVVFDSSAQYDGVSLNSVLLTGPDLNNTLVGVLIRFRREAIAVTADIKQMFHCFSVREQDRNFLRFLWFRDNDPSQDVIEHRMTVHVFGNSPSPAVAIYCLRLSAADGLNHDKEVEQFVMRDFYVDDGLKSFPTAESALRVLKGTQSTLAKSNLKLHKIASNSQRVMEGFPPDDRASDLKDLDLGSDAPPIQRSLGLSWDLASDTFTFKVGIEERPFTRRGVLSVVNSIYDPLGFVAPVTIQGKHILRELTQGNSDWDSPLPAEMAEQWTSWRHSLEDLSELHIQRPYTKVSPSTAKRRELCVFSDASVKAIGAVAYLKVTDNDGHHHVGFIMGKAKLAPQPEHTVPRLELCAAVLAVELADLISSELDLQIDATSYYTDSKVVLGYIYNETRRFYVYVSNRVIRIRASSDPQQWRYVATDQNPADHATRSVIAALLPQTTWLSGPSFLLQDPGGSQDAGDDFKLINPKDDAEVRPVSTLNTQATVQQLGSSRFSRFSSWHSLTRAVANLSHISHCYCSHTGGKGGNCRRWHLCHEGHTAPRISHAKCIVIRAVQQDVYGNELACLEKGMRIPPNSPIKDLDPFLDAEGLLRVGGRIRRGDFTREEKNPVIIPGKHHIATLLVRHHHEQTSHQGRLFTEGAIRTAGYWVTSMKRCVGSVLHQCVTCRRLRSSPEVQKMADLPADRLSMEPPFTNVGLDVFGPWTVVARRTRGGIAHSKRWAVMFTCLSVRAVHIELIEAMDTSSFVNAFRRFLAIRGPVKLIRSDRGTNFIGAATELKIPSNLDLSAVEQYLSQRGCSWVFNPPHAPHMGGAWERMIGIAKKILDAMFLQLGPSKLTHEALTTLMAEVAAIINARPLIPISTDPSDPFILTPATLLTQKVGVPAMFQDGSDVKDIPKGQWRQIQHLAQNFWSKWRKHYISQLQSRRKWHDTHPNLEPGTVVLLKDQQLKRNEWPLGIITQVFPSDDDKVRKAEIKVSRREGTKVLLRPITELVILVPPTQ